MNIIAFFHLHFFYQPCFLLFLLKWWLKFSELLTNLFWSILQSFLCFLKIPLGSLEFLKFRFLKFQEFYRVPQSSVWGSFRFLRIFQGSIDFVRFLRLSNFPLLPLSKLSICRLIRLLGLMGPQSCLDRFWAFFSILCNLIEQSVGRYMRNKNRKCMHFRW